MAVSQIFFFPYELTEIHLLAGGTVDLGAMLFLQIIGGAQQQGNAFNDPGSTLQFRPMLKNIGTVAGSVVNRGITVNTTTGVVTLDNPLAAGFKRNFIVEAVVTQVAVGANPAPAPLRVFVRINVHTSITSIWLTPDSLRVMRTEPLANGQVSNRRFALRAAFDDGIVGDITYHTNILGITWSPSADGSITIPGGTDVGAHIPVTATIGGLHDTRDAVVEGAWAADPALRAALVPGGAVESHASAETANMIFLAEGYATGQNQAFSSFVNGLVAYMNDPINRPYDLLKPNIAFWSVFFGRPAGGMSTGGEVYPVSETAGTFAMRFVPHPRRPRDGEASDKPWTLAELVYMAGMPMPGDLPGTSRTNFDIMAEWADILPDDPEPHLRKKVLLFWTTNDALIDDWRALATRCMIDDVDSALGVRVGSVRPETDEAVLTIDSTRMMRTTTTGIDGLFSGLTSSTGTNLAGVWNQVTDALFPVPAPMSHNMVCIVSPAVGRAANETQNGYFHLNHFSMYAGVLATRVAGNRFQLVPVVPLSVPNADHGRVFVHELTHSFRIGDEYGEHDAVNLPYDVATIDARYANLQVESATMRSVAGSAPAIFGDEIKWSWHRISRAAEISGPITESAGTLTVPLRGTQGTRFTEGMDLIIRGRTRGVPLQKQPPLSVLLSVVDVMDNRLEVIASILTYQYPGTLVDVATVPATFGAGSIIYSPIPAPAGITDPFLELVAFNIKQFITAQHAPLTKWPDVVDDSHEQKPNLDGVTLPDCFNKNRPRVVGLYSGGATYHRGVFHPTGHCLMRDSHSDGRELCMVCRYQLVDTLDPSRHGEVDATFVGVYPMRF